MSARATQNERLGVRFRYHARWCWRRPSVHPPGCSWPGGHRAISPGRALAGAPLGRSLGTPIARTLLLKAPSSTEGDGDAPVDPHRLHWSVSLELIGVSLVSLGRACACVPRRVLSGRRVDRWSAPCGSGSRDGPRRAGRRHQPRHVRRAASHPLLRCFDIDLAHGGWQRDQVCRKGVAQAGEPPRSAPRRSGCQS
jgi:hypothetical protein